MIQIFTLLFLTIVSSKLVFPLTEVDKQYLFNLTVEHSTLLFRIDFEGKQSSIRLPAHSKKNLTSKLNVLSKRHELGSMVFQEYTKNEADMDVGGVIGLGIDSSFIKMIEEKYGKTVGLIFDLKKSSVAVSYIPCENTHSSPFVLSIGTWSSFSISTQLSFNFNPPEDFLALLNTTKQPFILEQSRYNSLALDVEYLGYKKQILVKRLINCWKFSGNNNEECQVKLGNDVGLLMFEFPVVVTRNGLCLQGQGKGRIDYDSRFAGMILINIMTILTFIYWQDIRSRMRQQKIYIPTAVTEYSIEKISLMQDMVSG